MKGLFLTFFVLGMNTSYAQSDRSFLLDDVFKMQLESMRHMHQMMNQVHGTDLLGDHDLFNEQRKSVKTSQKEDSQFKYFEIDLEGVDKDNFKVKVEKGQISLSGAIKVVTTKKESGLSFSSTSISSFSQAYPVPSGVKEDKVDIQMQNKKMILKFPKVQS